jgi:hypothetical protein
MWKEVLMTQFMVLSWDFCGRAEENYETHQSESYTMCLWAISISNFTCLAPMIR